VCRVAHETAFMIFTCPVTMSLRRALSKSLSTVEGGIQLLCTSRGLLDKRLQDCSVCRAPSDRTPVALVYRRQNACMETVEKRVTGKHQCAVHVYDVNEA